MAAINAERDKSGRDFALPFDHFGNWHDDVAGWEAYLADRPGAFA